MCIRDRFYANMACGTDNPTLNFLYPPICTGEFMLAGALIYIAGLLILSHIAMKSVHEWWMKKNRALLRRHDPELMYYAKDEKVRREKFRLKNGKEIDVVVVKAGEGCDMLANNPKNEVVVVGEFRKAIGRKATEALCYHEYAHLEWSPGEFYLQILALGGVIFILVGVVPAVLIAGALFISINWLCESMCDLYAVKHAGRAEFLKALDRGYALRNRELYGRSRLKSLTNRFMDGLFGFTHPPYLLRRAIAAKV